MKKIVILLIIFAIVLVGFTHDEVTGSVEVEDATLVYVTIDDEMVQYYWTKDVSPYTVPLRSGKAKYDVWITEKEKDNVYRWQKHDRVYSSYEPNYLENMYDCFEFEDIEIDIEPIIQQVREYCDTQEGWVCEERSKYLAWVLRKNNIPCKVVVGQVYTDRSIRHAWNQVYFNGKWNVVDISLDDVKIRIFGWEE